MSNSVLSASAVEKKYRSGNLDLRVLSEANLEVTSGEFVSIQGESGCGKTTFLNVLAGLEVPDSGYISWGGQKLSGLKRNALARQRAIHLGIVFQSYYLVPELNASQNVYLNQRIANAGGSIEEAKELLRKVGLGDRFNQIPNTLSGGERQRVAIARALVTKPKVILADEPTGNLDEATGDSVMNLLQSICSETGTALVLVTHNPEHAARADRKLFLANGTLSEDR